MVFSLIVSWIFFTFLTNLSLWEIDQVLLFPGHVQKLLKLPFQFTVNTCSYTSLLDFKAAFLGVKKKGPKKNLLLEYFPTLKGALWKTGSLKSGKVSTTIFLTTPVRVESNLLKQSHDLTPAFQAFVFFYHFERCFVRTIRMWCKNPSKSFLNFSFRDTWGWQRWIFRNILARCLLWLRSFLSDLWSSWLGRWDFHFGNTLLIISILTINRCFWHCSFQLIIQFLGNHTLQWRVLNLQWKLKWRMLVFQCGRES